MSKLKLQALSIICMLAAFALDFLSKSWAHAALEPGIRQTFISGLLNFILVTNTGLAFSMVNHNELLARFLASAIFAGLIIFYCRRYLLIATISASPKPSQPDGAPNSIYAKQINSSNIEHGNIKTSLYSWLEQLGMSIIIGAAAGNLFERFVYGRVTDFLEFAFMNFPVFNVADVLIDTGVALVLISIYFSKKQLEKQ